MTDTNNVLNQVYELLVRLNQQEPKSSPLGDFLKNPIVITVIGSIMVAAGSNWVTKQFQLRDKQSDAIAELESQIPRDIAITKHTAMVMSVLEMQNCEQKPDKILTQPYVLGLTGKTCKEAEAEYLKYTTMLLNKPPGSSLVKVRALFESTAVDDGAMKLGILVSVLSVTADPTCIIHTSRQAEAAYGELIDLTINEIDGIKVRKTPDVFDLSNLVGKCSQEDLCRTPGYQKEKSSKTQCSIL